MAAMDLKLEVIHVGFLWQVTGKKTQWLGDDSWRKVVAKRKLQTAGTKNIKT